MTAPQICEPYARTLCGDTSVYSLESGYACDTGPSVTTRMRKLFPKTPSRWLFLGCYNKYLLTDVDKKTFAGLKFQRDLFTTKIACGDVGNCQLRAATFEDR